MGKDVLETINLGQLVVSKQSLITVQSNCTLEEALSMLCQYHIQSLPIEDDSKDKLDGPFLGVIDIMDIVMFVVFGNFSNIEDIKSEQLQGVKLQSITVSDVIGVSDQLMAGMWSNGVYEFEQARSLSDALELLIAGVKRLLVKCGSGKSPVDYKCLSQLDAISAIVLHANEMKEICDMTVSDAGLLISDEFNELCCVGKSQSVLIGLRKMLINKADAVAVIDADGVLVATLSCSDVRFLYGKTHDLSALLRSIEEFHVEVHGGMRNPVYVRTSSTILEALNNCYHGKMHRVWVVDDNLHPIGCIRIQDMLVKFSKLDYKHV